jgi:uncharacterized protein (UPF0333 family)
MERKGQAAMEFLMTYGWAILAAIIVIGVLAVYFRPSGLSSGQTRLNPPLYSVAARADASDNNIQIDVRNDGDAINVAIGGLIVTLSTGQTCTSNNAAVVPMSVGTTSSFTTNACSGSLDVVQGTDYQGTIAISYTAAGSALVQTATGVFSENAQA